jgi:glycerol uptake facilitator-like aquaporin
LDFLAGKRIDIEPNEYAWIFVVAYFAAAILGDILGFIGHFLG